MHSPTLRTIQMIEETLKEAGEVLSIAEIKRRLPKKVMHQTLLTVLDYLQANGRILIGTKGVLWTYMTQKEYDKLMAETHEYDVRTHSFLDEGKKNKRQTPRKTVAVVRAEN